jgi:hypothetical protein
MFCDVLQIYRIRDTLEDVDTLLFASLLLMRSCLVGCYDGAHHLLFSQKNP